MKVSIKRWLGFAALPAALLMLGLSAPAHAVSYQCNDVQNEPNDSIEINQTGNCTISSSITAKNDITINVTGGTIDTQGLTSTEGKIIINVQGNATFNDELKADEEVVVTATSGGNIDAKAKITSTKQFITLESKNGDVKTKDVSAGLYMTISAGLADADPNETIEVDGDLVSNTVQVAVPGELGDPNSSGSNILLRAHGPIKTKNISTNGGPGAAHSSCGGIQIDPYLFQTTATKFTIGDDTNNGVNGVLDTSGSTGGGQNPQYLPCGIRITNGGASAPGDIEINNFGSISTFKSASRGDVIILDAQEGILTLPAGTFGSNNGSNNGAGLIYLLAKEIIANSGTIISTSQPDSAPGTAHGVLISTEKLTYSGAPKLTIESDGKGLGPSGLRSQVLVVPKGGIISQSSNDAMFLVWTLPFSNFENLPGTIEFDGGAGADLEVRADGEDTYISITGDNLIFTGGDVQIQTKGGKNDKGHDIFLGMYGNNSNNKRLTVNNSGTFELFARGEGQDAAGGEITIEVHNTQLNAMKVNFKANGPANKDGDSGTISFDTDFLVVGDNTRVKFDADASTNGKGNAQISRNGRKAIYFKSEFSPIVLGLFDGHINFSANGGGFEGDGGAIEINSNERVRIRNRSEIIQAKALGDNGNGGEVLINSPKTVFVQDADSPGQMIQKAITSRGGFLTGNGGSIRIPFAEAKTGNTHGALNVNALMTVNGGTNESTSTPYGSLDLNGVICNQNKTGFQSWPLTVWQCDGSNHGSEIAQAAFDLPVQLKSQAGNLSSLTPDNPNIEIYNMQDLTRMRLFFGQQPGPVSLRTFGHTLPLIRASATFEFIYDLENGSGVIYDPVSYSQSLTIREISILHELGHQFDYMWDDPSINLIYDSAIQFDKITVGGINLDSNNQIRPCTDIFLVATCQAFPNTSNFDILFAKYAGQSKQELFAITFGELVGVPNNYSNILELKTAISYLSAGQTYINGLITSPPMPVN